MAAGETIVRRMIAEMDARDVGMSLKVTEANKRIAELEKRFTTLNERASDAGKTGAQSANVMGDRFRAASMQMASAAENAARAGKLTGESAKQLIAQGTSIAFMFGKAGPIAGAIGILGLAIHELWSNARKEMEESRKQFEKEIDAMVNAGDSAGLMQRYKEIELGTPAKDFEDGTKFRQARLTEVQRQLQIARAKGEGTIDPESGMRMQSPEVFRLVNEEQALVRSLAKDYASLSRLRDEIMNPTTIRAGTGIAPVVSTAKPNATPEELAKQAKQAEEERLKLIEVSRKVGEGAVETLDKILEKQRELDDEARALAAQMTTTLVDDMTVSLAALERALRKAGRSEAFIQDVVRWKSTLIGAQETVEEVTAGLAHLAASGLKPLEEMRGLSKFEDQIKTQIAALGTAKETEAARAVLAKQLEAIEKRRTELADENAQHLERQRRSTSDVASTIAAATDAAYGLAQALGLGNSEAGRMLTAVGSIARGIAKIGEKGWGALSTAEKLGVVGAIGGGVIALGSQIFGDNPEEKARRETLERNTRAILELTGKIGLLGLELSGADATAARTVLARGRAEGWDTLTNEDWNALSRAAEGLGIEFDKTVGAVNRLERALEHAITRLGEFDDTFAGWSQWFDAMQRANPSGSPSVGLDFLKSQGERFSPAVAGILDVDGDWSDPAVREEIRKRALAYLERARPGGDDNITAEELGGLQGDEFMQVLMQIFEQLDLIASSVATRLRTALEDIDTESEILDLDPEQRFAKRAEAYKSMGGALGDLFEGLDVTDPADVAQLDERVRALFEQLRTSPGSVDLAGLSIEELIRVLLDLDGAADQVAASVQTAAGKFAEAAGLLDTEFQIMGTGSAEQATAIAGAAGASFSSIAEALAGIDLTTADGRQRAIEALQALYQANKGDKELASAILSVLNAIRAVPGDAAAAGAAGRAAASGETSAVASGARNLSEATGNRMADYLSTIAIQTLAIRQAVESLLARAMAAVITPPAIGFGGIPAIAGSGNTIVQVRVQLVVNVMLSPGMDLSPEGAQRVGQYIGRGASQVVSEQIASGVQQVRLDNGDTSRPGY